MDKQYIIAEGIVSKFGNSAHMIVPKSFIGRRANVIMKQEQILEGYKELKSAVKGD